MTRMNGQQALAYARSRHATSDFDRSARQQRVITSVRDQTDLSSILQPGVLSELIKEFRKDVKTNVPPKQLPASSPSRRTSTSTGARTSCSPMPPATATSATPAAPPVSGC